MLSNYSWKKQYLRARFVRNRSGAKTKFNPNVHSVRPGDDRDREKNFAPVLETSTRNDLDKHRALAGAIARRKDLRRRTFGR